MVSVNPDRPTPEGMSHPASRYTFTRIPSKLDEGVTLVLDSVN